LASRVRAAGGHRGVGRGAKLGVPKAGALPSRGRMPGRR
jgi:hypothetical protein